MRFIEKVNDFIEIIVKRMCALFLMIFAAMVLLQVIARNYLAMAFTWTIELSLMLFMWVVFLGAAVAFRQRRHYIIEVFPAKWEKLNALLDVIADGVCFLLVYVLAFGGCHFTIMSFQRLCSSVDLSQSWLVGVMPISAALMTLFGVEIILGDLRRLLSIRREGI
ncbi:MAG: hypothetical protein CSA35_01760 [Dethiosulfovibrio peptidovorans]|nr:MAG: hypothetical protein CSA35_01760 [Dethiosulfovibrio peptidovorans]